MSIYYLVIVKMCLYKQWRLFSGYNVVPKCIVRNLRAQSSKYMYTYFQTSALEYHCCGEQIDGE